MCCSLFFKPIQVPLTTNKKLLIYTLDWLKLSIFKDFCYDRDVYLYIKELKHVRKADRHILIKKLISNHTIHTQEELLTLLKAKGVTATQATISRDIRELKIIKSPDGTGQWKFEVFKDSQITNEAKEKKRLIQMIQDVVVKVDRVQIMTILNTIPDNAQILSAVIDEVEIPGKVCSLAGFDTVIIISRTEADAETAEKFFREHTF